MINVLIVDDSPLIRKMLRRHVTDSGIDLGEIFDAGDGKEGLKALETNHIDLMLCDVNMPEMDGLELLKLVRENALWKTLPVIMVTTESGRESVTVAVELGANGYVRKPFTPDEVKTALKSCLAA